MWHQLDIIRKKLLKKGILAINSHQNYSSKLLVGYHAGKRTVVLFHFTFHILISICFYQKVHGHSINWSDEAELNNKYSKGVVCFVHCKRVIRIRETGKMFNVQQSIVSSYSFLFWQSDRKYVWEWGVRRGDRSDYFPVKTILKENRFLFIAQVKSEQTKILNF